MNYHTDSGIHMQRAAHWTDTYGKEKKNENERREKNRVYEPIAKVFDIWIWNCRKGKRNIICVNLDNLFEVFFPSLFFTSSISTSIFFSHRLSWSSSALALRYVRPVRVRDARGEKWFQFSCRLKCLRTNDDGVLLGVATLPSETIDWTTFITTTNKRSNTIASSTYVRARLDDKR